MIWRPHRAKAGDPPGQDRFLEINVTSETLTFEEIPGNIPNRGLLQDDIDMFGVTYLQQISDHNVKVNGKPAGLHIEPGIWARVPPTSDPKETGTVVRMASIPHGTTILARGVPLVVAGGPKIDDTNILPFPINGGTGLHFPEQNLSQPTAFRSPASNIAGVTQQMVDNPNSVLKTAIQGLTFTGTTVFVISTDHTPVAGGGTSNTAFLQGLANGTQRQGQQGDRDLLDREGEGDGRRPRPPHLAVYADRPARLQRAELAPHHGGDAAQEAALQPARRCRAGGIGELGSKAVDLIAGLRC